MLLGNDRSFTGTNGTEQKGTNAFKKIGTRPAHELGVVPVERDRSFTETKGTEGNELFKKKNRNTPSPTLQAKVAIALDLQRCILDIFS